MKLINLCVRHTGLFGRHHFICGNCYSIVCSKDLSKCNVTIIGRTSHKLHTTGADLFELGGKVRLKLVLNPNTYIYILFIYNDAGKIVSFWHRLTSDLESYIGAVERISHYIDDTANEQHQQKKCK